MAVASSRRNKGAERDVLFLRLARDMLLERGYHGLTMARVAKAAEYAKGTIYQHFSCKEELIVALATESVDKQRGLVERAACFVGRPRERIMAVGVATDLFARLYEEDARIFQIMTGEAIMQKASEASLRRLRSSALRTVSIMTGIVRDGIVQGDLHLGPTTTIEDVIYPVWLLGDAGKAARTCWLPPEEMGIKDPFETILRHGTASADGYGWRPLSTEWDYAETMRRIRSEIFPEESRRAYG